MPSGDRGAAATSEASARGTPSNVMTKLKIRVPIRISITMASVRAVDMRARRSIARLRRR